MTSEDDGTGEIPGEDNGNSPVALPTVGGSSPWRYGGSASSSPWRLLANFKDEDAQSDEFDEFGEEMPSPPPKPADSPDFQALRTLSGTPGSCERYLRNTLDGGEVDANAVGSWPRCGNYTGTREAQKAREVGNDLYLQVFHRMTEQPPAMPSWPCRCKTLASLPRGRFSQIDGQDAKGLLDSLTSAAQPMPMAHVHPHSTGARRSPKKSAPSTPKSKVSQPKEEADSDTRGFQWQDTRRRNWSITNHRFAPFLSSARGGEGDRPSSKASSRPSPSTRTPSPRKASHSRTPVARVNKTVRVHNYQLPVKRPQTPRLHSKSSRRARLKESTLMMVTSTQVGDLKGRLRTSKLWQKLESPQGERSPRRLITETSNEDQLANVLAQVSEMSVFDLCSEDSLSRRPSSMAAPDRNLTPVQKTPRSRNLPSPADGGTKDGDIIARAARRCTTAAAVVSMSAGADFQSEVRSPAPEHKVTTPSNQTTRGSRILTDGSEIGGIDESLVLPPSRWKRGATC